MNRALKSINRSWLEGEYSVQCKSCSASPTGSNPDPATSQLCNLSSYLFFDASVSSSPQ